MSHISDPPIFSSRAYMHTCLYRGFVLVRGGFVPGLSGGFLSGRFRPGWFLSFPLLSEYIHYNRKLNITYNFRFHMYDIFCKSVTSHALGPPSSVTNCHTFSDPLSPSSVTYFMDGPDGTHLRSGNPFMRIVRQNLC